MSSNEPAARTSPLLTVDQVAARLSISRRLVWQLLARGQLAAIRLGPRTTRIDAREVERLLRAHGAQPEGAVEPRSTQ